MGFMATATLSAFFVVGFIFWLLGKYGELTDFARLVRRVTNIESKEERLRTISTVIGAVIMTATVVGAFGPTVVKNLTVSLDLPNVSAPTPTPAPAHAPDESLLPPNPIDSWTLTFENNEPRQFGNCPSDQCFRFELGRDYKIGNTRVIELMLSGGGFIREVTLGKLGGGATGYEITFHHLSKTRFASLLDIRPVNSGYPAILTFPLEYGAATTLQLKDQDIEIVISDDRSNHVEMRVGRYPPTVCSNDSRWFMNERMKEYWGCR